MGLGNDVSGKEVNWGWVWMGEGDSVAYGGQGGSMHKVCAAEYAVVMFIVVRDAVWPCWWHLETSV